MTQPEIKKYRRRVTDARVKQAAKAVQPNSNMDCQHIQKLTRLILEAHAEVIAGRFEEYHQTGNEWILYFPPDEEFYEGAWSKEQFNQEWEEIA